MTGFVAFVVDSLGWPFHGLLQVTRASGLLRYQKRLVQPLGTHHTATNWFLLTIQAPCLVTPRGRGCWSSEGVVVDNQGWSRGSPGVGPPDVGCLVIFSLLSQRSLVVDQPAHITNHEPSMTLWLIMKHLASYCSLHHESTSWAYYLMY